MDPLATWKNLDDAMRSHDREAIGQAADALVGWYEKGGFIGSEIVRRYGMGRPGLLRMLRDLRAVAEMV